MPEKRARGRRFAWLLLVPPYIALMWVNSYNSPAPVLFGIPFFYWYQLLWIPLGVLLLYLLYRAEESREMKDNG